MKLNETTTADSFLPDGFWICEENIVTSMVAFHHMNHMVWDVASSLPNLAHNLLLFVYVDHDRPERSGCIGKKGIGWKSTFAVSNCPHVTRVKDMIWQKLTEMTVMCSCAMLRLVVSLQYRHHCPSHTHTQVCIYIYVCIMYVLRMYHVCRILVNGVHMSAVRQTKWRVGCAWPGLFAPMVPVLMASCSHVMSHHVTSCHVISS